MDYKSVVAALLLAITPATSWAGEGDNIKACTQAVQDFGGRVVDEFDAHYEGRMIDLSEVKWPGVVCAVKLGLVFDLTVDGKKLIVDQFSGEEAKRTYERLEVRTEEAIAILKSREKILERRLADAEAKLQQPNADITEIAAHVETGIEKSVGQ